MSTLPMPQGLWKPMLRPSPWDRGWEHRHPAAMPTMLTARSAEGQPVRASTWHYAPQHLLYRRDLKWASIPVAGLSRAVRMELPECLRAGWDLLAAGQAASWRRMRIFTSLHSQ